LSAGSLGALERQTTDRFQQDSSDEAEPQPTLMGPPARAGGATAKESHLRHYHPVLHLAALAVQLVGERLGLHLFAGVFGLSDDFLSSSVPSGLFLFSTYLHPEIQHPSDNDIDYSGRFRLNPV
jgi:hypothetical protein